MFLLKVWGIKIAKIEMLVTSYAFLVFYCFPMRTATKISTFCFNFQVGEPSVNSHSWHFSHELFIINSESYAFDRKINQVCQLHTKYLVLKHIQISVKVRKKMLSFFKDIWGGKSEIEGIKIVAFSSPLHCLICHSNSSWSQGSEPRRYDWSGKQCPGEGLRPTWGKKGQPNKGSQVPEESMQRRCTQQGCSLARWGKWFHTAGPNR